MPAGVSCFVIDDHPAMVDAIGGVLEAAAAKVVGRAESGQAAMHVIGELRPDIAILDLGLPDVDGLEVTRFIKLNVPDTRIVLYTGWSSRSSLLAGLDAGAEGYVLKGAPIDELIRAVRIVAGGGNYVDPTIASCLKPATDMPQLSAREREILRLLADGLNNEEIGRRLYISHETVRTHLRKAMGKLGANTRAHAVALALRASVIR
jgi:DNA-binding NarL/FixJ family response regulator